MALIIHQSIIQWDFLVFWYKTARIISLSLKITSIRKKNIIEMKLTSLAMTRVRHGTLDQCFIDLRDERLISKSVLFQV